MDTLGWIIAGTAFAGLAYYGFRHKKNPKSIDDINIFNTPVEHISTLSLSDIKTYFKGLSLQKDEDLPILKRIRSNDKTTYLLAIYHETTKSLTHVKILLPDTIDPKVEELLGNEEMVVLS